MVNEGGSPREDEEGGRTFEYTVSIETIDASSTMYTSEPKTTAMHLYMQAHSTARQISCRRDGGRVPKCPCSDHWYSAGSGGHRW